MGLICGLGDYQTVGEEMDAARGLLAVHMMIAHPGQRWMDDLGVMHG